MKIRLLSHNQETCKQVKCFTCQLKSKVKKFFAVKFEIITYILDKWVQKLEML